MRRLVRALAALMATGFMAAALAQAPSPADYPKQPIRMVVTFPPGYSPHTGSYYGFGPSNQITCP